MKQVKEPIEGSVTQGLGDVVEKELGMTEESFDFQSRF